MNKFLTPLEAQTIQQDREHLEVVVLLVTNDINHLVNGIVLETHLGRTDVLRHIDRSAIATQQQLLIKSLVGQVSPYTIVLMALEETLGESLLHFGLALEVSLRFVVYLIKANAHLLVGLIETSIHPVVHFFPQGTHLWVVVLPLHQHLVSFLNQWSLLLGLFFVHALGNEFLDFLTVMLVKGYIVVANQVIALLA